MATILLSTTGVLGTVTLNDMGARKFVHPVSNLNITNEYDLYEITSSDDLQTAINNNYVTLTSDGFTMSNLSDISMFKSTYDQNSDEVIDLAGTASNALALDGFSGSYYLDLANATGTLGTSSAPVWQVNGQSGNVILDTGDVSENGNLYFTNTRARAALSGATGISYNSTSGEIQTNDSQIDHDALLNYDITEHRVINDSGTSSTELWSASKIASEVASAAASGGVTDVNGQTGSVTLNTDDISEGSSNLYFTDQRARNVISVAAGSEPYMSYATASGELTVKNLLITDVTTDTSATSSEAYFSANYSGTEFQEGDVVILAGLTGGSEVFIHNGLTGGTASDFTHIDTPHINDGYVKSLFSATAPLSYNATSGDFSISQSGTASDGYLSSADYNTFVNGINGSVQTVNGVTGPTVVIDTDNVTEGSTNLYHTTQRARESVVGGTGIGYTASNGIIYLDANIDDLNDVDTTTVAPSIGDNLEWDGSNWVPVTPDTDVGKKTWMLQASAATNNATNRYLSSGNNFTNTTPLISHFDSEIVSLSIATDGAESWTGIVFVNGATATQIIATASAKEYKNTITGVTMSAGSEISLYLSGSNIKRPRMEVMLREL